MAYDIKKLDPKLCKKSVAPHVGWNSPQCSRKVWKDGFCKQHHPDTARARREKNDKKRMNNHWEVRMRRNAAIEKALRAVVTACDDGAMGAEFDVHIDAARNALTSDHRV